MNLAVVRGTCSGAPEVRQLGSGARVGSLAVTARRGDEPATSVPVTVWDPPAWLETLVAGDDVVVLGRVRRRFFRRRAGGLGSAVEVVADRVWKADRRSLAVARRRADQTLGELED